MSASWVAYTGILMLMIGCYPFMDTELDSSRAFEASWHLWLFTAAGLATYGLEMLRRDPRSKSRLGK